jgi:hypothetical protein
MITSIKEPLMPIYKGSLGMGVVGAIYRGGKAGTIRKKLS